MRAAALSGMRWSTLGFLVLLLLAMPSAATTYLGRTRTIPPQSVVGATEIQGRVGAVRSEGGGRQVRTRVTLALDAPGLDGVTTADFLAPGGSSEGVRTWVSGAPEFAVGEHVRLNVRATRSGLHLAGLADGKVLLP